MTIWIVLGVALTLWFSTETFETYRNVKKVILRALRNHPDGLFSLELRTFVEDELGATSAGMVYVVLHQLVEEKQLVRTESDGPFVRGGRPYVHYRLFTR